MKINDIILDRFLNNDLPRPKINKIKLLIKKDPKLRSRVQELKSFESAYEKEYDFARKTKMPKSLYEKISVEQNTKKNYALNKFSNFYKIAAGISAFVLISWVITTSNKTYLSEKNYLPNKNHYTSKIYYTKSERDLFLSKYNHCKATKKKTFDENNKEVFPVICKIE